MSVRFSFQGPRQSALLPSALGSRILLAAPVSSTLFLNRLSISPCGWFGVGSAGVAPGLACSRSQGSAPFELAFASADGSGQNWQTGHMAEAPPSPGGLSPSEGHLSGVGFRFRRPRCRPLCLRSFRRSSGLLPFSSANSAALVTRRDPLRPSSPPPRWSPHGFSTCGRTVGSAGLLPGFPELEGS